MKESRPEVGSAKHNHVRFNVPYLGKIARLERLRSIRSRTVQKENLWICDERNANIGPLCLRKQPVIALRGNTEQISLSANSPDSHLMGREIKSD